VLVARRARAPAADRRIDGQNQRREARCRDALDQGVDFGTIGPIVELKPLRSRAPLGRGLLEKHVGEARHDISRVGFCGATGGRAFAFAMEQFMPAGRRHHDRVRHGGTQQRHPRVDSFDVIEHARPQADIAPGRDVLDRADLVIGAGGAERE
jgi:hypothetical protein